MSRPPPTTKRTLVTGVTGTYCCPGQIQAEIQEVSRALQESTKNLCRNLKDNPNISGNLMKIQRERTELIDLLNVSCRQIAQVRASLAY